MAKFLGDNLTQLLGQVSGAHIRSTEEFADFAKCCTTEGRNLYLDVVNLFSSIPRDKIIKFLRDQSSGWGPNPPAGANPANPPRYNFGIDSKVFCDLIEICLSYNQFHVEGNFYRQIQGLFMGSSVSPPLAMLYLEYFEKYLYEKEIPNNLKAREWKRFVDDIFLIYEHSDEEFQSFFDRLNTLDPDIRFTYELASPGRDLGLSDRVVEALPFLDLFVMRYLDPISNTLCNKLSIYRKSCHSGTYIHAFSCQPKSTKMSVIRNMFLRAYRYCDEIFLEAEERKIYGDFDRLGYSKSFINKAKISAKQGRTREIRIRLGLEQPKSRERSNFYLGLPYNKSSKGSRYTLALKGVDVAFTTRDSVRSRITYRKSIPIYSGVYLLACILNSCYSVYVGESGNIPKRQEEHFAAKTRPSWKVSYASAKHTDVRRGHDILTANAHIPYRSPSLSRRLLIEACLISQCQTVKGNKSSSFAKDIQIIAPIVLKAAPIDWKVIAEVQPWFKIEIVPKKFKSLFLSNQQTSRPTSANRNNHLGIHHNEPGPPIPIHNYHTRSSRDDTLQDPIPQSSLTGQDTSIG